ncbi:MAG: hypothetical protein E7616_06860 [Ruminococcaceae bacterium]|nr:hypothetical protein [Oscillospiraceae bacterium]
MKFIAERKSGKVTSLTVLLYVVGVLLFLIPAYIGMTYGAFLQFSSIIVLAFAIQLTIRYMLTSFTYEIYDYASSASSYPVLNIYRTQGERSTLLASCGFEDMISIEKRSKIEDNVSKAANYCPEFGAKNVYRILFSDGNKEKAIYLQCDESFAAALSERIMLYGVNRETIENG